MVLDKDLVLLFGYGAVNDSAGEPGAAEVGVVGADLDWGAFFEVGVWVCHGIGV